MADEFGARLVALENALQLIAGLPRKAGLFEAQRIAKAALAGEAVATRHSGRTLADPKYYAIVRARLERNWGNRCAYCGIKGARVPLEIEHALPVSRGGSDEPTNLLLACHDCNHRKGTQTLEEFSFGSLGLRLAGQTFGL